MMADRLLELHGDAELYIDDQHSRQHAARQRGLGFLLATAGYLVGDEPHTDSHLVSALGSMFGYTAAVSEEISRLLVGKSSSGHVFKRGPNGILTHHYGLLGDMAQITH